ncbi:MAG TPA: hypothetical protein VGG94_01320, partial [Chthoniobacterales bacterium]
MQPEKVWGQAAEKVAWESRRRRKVVGFENQQAENRMTTPGTMMNFPLTLPTILERAGHLFPSVEVVSRRPDASITRSCYGEMYQRARR